jgi:hypothetical protein
LILDYTPRKLILFQNKIHKLFLLKCDDCDDHFRPKQFYFDNDECSCEFNEDNIIFTVDDLKLNFDDIEWDQKLYFLFNYLTHSIKNIT